MKYEYLTIEVGHSKVSINKLNYVYYQEEGWEPIMSCPDIDGLVIFTLRREVKKPVIPHLQIDTSSSAIKDGPY